MSPHVLDFDRPDLAALAEDLRGAVARGERLEREPRSEQRDAELELAKIAAERARYALSQAGGSREREREREREHMPALSEVLDALDDPEVREHVWRWLEACSSMQKAYRDGDGPDGDRARRALGAAKREIDRLTNESLGTHLRRVPEQVLRERFGRERKIENVDLAETNKRDGEEALAVGAAADELPFARDQLPQLERLVVEARGQELTERRPCEQCRSLHANPEALCDACLEKSWLTSGNGKGEDLDDELEGEPEAKERRVGARRNFTDDQRREIARRVSAGESVTALSKEYDVKPISIRRIAERFGEAANVHRDVKPSKSKVAKPRARVTGALAREAEASVAPGKGDGGTQFAPSSTTKPMPRIEVEQILIATADPEAHAIASVVDALCVLDDKARARVWDYLSARFA